MNWTAPSGPIKIIYDDELIYSHTAEESVKVASLGV